MDDKELIIFAAKVAGIDHPGGEHSRYDDGRLWDCKGLRWWNPLADDGDALRLAVKLRLDIQINCDEAAVISADVDGWVSEPVIDEDIGAATRRAIVRAAAGIARKESSNE